MAPPLTIAPGKSPADSPYKLEPAQVLKASQALLANMRDTRKKNEAKSEKRNLLAEGDDGDSETAEPVWLIFTTKKHIAEQKTLKPKRILMPHTLNTPSAVSSICLITSSPQRAFKDVVSHPSFPKNLGDKIRIHGVDKVQARFKSYEQRRQLRDMHDVFLADDRVITVLPRVIGKILYDSSVKRPLPVNLAPPRAKDENGKTIKAEKKILSNKRTKAENDKTAAVASPEAFAREVERALSSAQIYLGPSTNTSVRIGFTSFPPQHLVENIEAVVKGMVENIVPRQWRNIKSIHIKGPNSLSFPVWLASELWEDDQDVLEDQDADQAKALTTQKGRKRKGQEEDVKPGKRNKALQEGVSQGSGEGFSKEMAERRERLREQKREAKKLVAAGA